MKKEPIAWITVGGKHVPIFDEDTTKDSDNKSTGFKDGDTPKAIDDNETYEVIKVSLDDNKDANMGFMSGKDAKSILKDCKYEEMVPGDGMWYKRGVSTYGYTLKKKGK